MKILFSCFIFMFALSEPASAFTALCKSAGFGPQTFGHETHYWVYSKMELDCKLARSGQPMDFDLQAYGPLFEAYAGGGIVIECPGVSEKRLNKVIAKRGKWSVVGAGASVGIIMAGARAGVAVNERGAVCVLVGVSFIDFGAVAGGIRISTKGEDVWDYGIFPGDDEDNETR